MTIQAAGYYCIKQLRKVFDQSEAANISGWLMEKLTGSSKIERMVYKNEELPAGEEQMLQDWIARLQRHEPVQYILNEAWFGKLKLYVDNNVLIPRPETEELVEWIVEDYKTNAHSFNIIDIGTGSGCIAISLAKKLPLARISACDISQGALQVAKRNAVNYSTTINFFQCDMLDESNWAMSAVDLIVSNPPYIPFSDKKAMNENVTAHEPGIALFVEDGDPLIFYSTLARIGKTALQKGGSIYCEIHESMGESLTTVFSLENYAVTLKKDMQGKDRMIKATCLSEK